MSKKLSIIVFGFFMIFRAQASFAAVFFNDGLESGNLSYIDPSSGARWGTSNTGPGDSVSVSTDRAHTGSYSLKFLFNGGASGEDAWAEQRFSLGSNKYDFYVRFYIFFPSNFSVRTDSPNNNKAIVVWGDNYSSRGAQGQEFSDSSFMPKAHKTWIGSGWELDCNGSFGYVGTVDGIGEWSLSELPLGEWVSFEYHFKANHGANDGAMEFWVNGQRKYGATGLDWFNSPCSPEYFNTGYLLGWSNSGYDEDTIIYIDDVVFSDQYIGTMSDDPPLPPLATPEDFKRVFDQ